MRALTTYNRYPSLFDEWFEEFFNEDNGHTEHHTPEIEIKRNEKEYRITAHVPGLKKEDLKIEVENGYLTFSGKFKEQHENEYETVHSEFRSSTEFKRSLRIDESKIDVDHVDAKLKNGILEIKLPLRPEVKPKQIEVKAA